eukprot:12143907-Ditylum_brightwellii.AAC.1
MACTKIKTVIASAAVVELGTLFTKCKAAAEIKNALEEMRLTHQPTAVMTDNSTAVGIINGTIKQHKTRAIEMRFYWIKDKKQQGQFLMYQMPG